MSLKPIALPCPASPSTTPALSSQQPLIKAPSSASSPYHQRANSTNFGAAQCPHGSSACPSTPPPPSSASPQPRTQYTFSNLAHRLNTAKAAILRLPPSDLHLRPGFATVVSVLRATHNPTSCALPRTALILTQSHRERTTARSWA